MKTCGQCVHAKVIPGDLMLRTCRGGPPQLIVMRGPRGVLLQSAFPNVKPADEACGAFKPLMEPVDIQKTVPYPVKVDPILGH